MAKFHFNLEVGFISKSGSRTMLNNSKNKLENAYPGSYVSIIENESFLGSEFIIRGRDFPDTKEFENIINNWFDKLKSL